MFLSSSVFEEYRSLRELANRELGINTVESGLHLASHTCSCPPALHQGPHGSAPGATRLHPHTSVNQHITAGGPSGAISGALCMCCYLHYLRSCDPCRSTLR